MAPFFAGIAGAIKGQAGFGLGRKARGKSRIETKFTYTSPGSISIPGVALDVVISAGGQGNNAPDAFVNGAGGFVRGTFTNLSGKTLTINFGGAGPNRNPAASPSGAWGFAKPGGNYAGVFDGPVSHGNSLMIAGGGGGRGGSSSNTTPGGAGGGTTGGTGGTGSFIQGSGTAAIGGAGGTQVAGGSAGSNGGPQAPWNGGATPGTSGSALQGGYSSSNSWNGNTPGGGGAGGYYGGGGGGCGAGDGPAPSGGNGVSPVIGKGGGGGGGSSYIHPTATLTTNTQGGNPAPSPAYVEITYAELL